MFASRHVRLVDYVAAGMSSDSKFLARALRHEPELIGIQLDPHGWVQVDDLLLKLKDYGRRITRDQLVEVVEYNDKQRFALSPDRRRIRRLRGTLSTSTWGCRRSPHPTRSIMGLRQRHPVRSSRAA